MGIDPRRFAPAAVTALLVWAAGAGSLAQAVHHDTGQDVAPAFEGWESNPDGSYNFVFGYLNRNYQEELDIPLGPDNSFDSGAPDRGQPTHFYARRQRFVFRVAVPKDWDKTRRLTWTLKSKGRTNLAKGWLSPEWELNPGVISENNNGGVLEAGNTPPTISASDTETVTLPNVLTLKTTASDDGLPKPRPRRAANLDAAAAAAAAAAANPDAPVRQTEGLRIRWVHYRGPGKVTFDPERSTPTYKFPATETTTVRFTEPGTYVIRAIAGDGQLETARNVTVTVKPASQ